MDLTSVLLRAVTRRPHVLLVPAVGGTAARLSLEAALARRGWPTATGPADADLVVVAGSPGPELGTAVERVWQQVPKPRTRVVVTDPADVDRQLDAAVVLLADRDHQQAGLGADEHDAHQGHEGPEAHGHGHEDDEEHGPAVAHTGHAADHGHEGEQAGPVDGAAGEGHQDHDSNESHADHEGHVGHHEGHVGHEGHGGHHGHDGHGIDEGQRHEGHEAQGHEGHEGRGGHHAHHGHGGGMEMPGGLPMADLGEDRDGLTLDRLHVPLGPVLPDWPAGLVVRVTLQGDVIQEAAAEVLDGGTGDEHRQWPADAATRELDGLARFLGVAGWADAAERARRLRDDLLAHGSTEQIAGAVAALVRRVRRSRTLRWLLRGTPAGASDVAGLLEQRLAAIEEALAPCGAPPVPRPSVDEVANLLVGAEFAAARLIVAALDPDTEQVPVDEGVRHG